MTTKKQDPFRIDINDIPQEGLSREWTIPAEWTPSILRTPYSTTGRRPQLTYRLERFDDNIQLVGDLKFSAAFDCGRCAETVQVDYEFSVSALFVPAQRHRTVLGNGGVDTDAAETVHEYVEGSLDLEGPFAEAAVLRLDPYPICSPSCKGVCLCCGTNLNTLACECRPGKNDLKANPLAALAHRSGPGKKVRSGG